MSRFVRDADEDPPSLSDAGSAEHGSVSVDSLGGIHYRAPADNWVGFDSFSYRITDGRGGFSEARATLEVRPNTSPDVYDEVLTTKEDTVSAPFWERKCSGTDSYFATAHIG
ncbi:Ig-like domain-containing protein [Desulfobulbus oralis]|uniref:Ig-like domain-containing protein n=1 Tax=Desulfobulbus oralis TaxID=1986146 RepID=UPI003CCBCAA0